MKKKYWAKWCNTGLYDEDNDNKNNDDDDVVVDDDDNDKSIKEVLEWIFNIAKKAVTYSHIEHTSEQFKTILHSQVIVIIIIIIIFDTSIAHFNVGIWSNAHIQKWKLYRTKVILPTVFTEIIYTSNCFSITKN